MKKGLVVLFVLLVSGAQGQSKAGTGRILIRFQEPIYWAGDPKPTVPDRIDAEILVLDLNGDFAKVYSSLTRGGEEILPDRVGPVYVGHWRPAGRTIVASAKSTNQSVDMGTAGPTNPHPGEEEEIYQLTRTHPTWKIELGQDKFEELASFRDIKNLYEIIEYAKSVAASDLTVYRNQEYGIVLPVPPGALLCIPPVEAHGIDHGAQLLLGTEDATLCRKYSGKRYMDVFASYNVADDTKYLHDLLEYSCESRAKKPCSPAPADLQIPGMQSEAGRMDKPDGLIEIVVVTQAGKPDPDFDASVPLMQYEFGLITDAQHIEDDLRIFRVMLNSVTISPDDH